MTGGLPPLHADIDEVYRRTYARTLERNRRYHARYPRDRDRLARVHERLAVATCGCRGATC